MTTAPKRKRTPKPKPPQPTLVCCACGLCEELKRTSVSAFIKRGWTFETNDHSLLRRIQNIPRVWERRWSCPACSAVTPIERMTAPVVPAEQQIAGQERNPMFVVVSRKVTLVHKFGATETRWTGELLSKRKGDSTAKIYVRWPLNGDIVFKLNGDPVGTKKGQTPTWSLSRGDIAFFQKANNEFGSGTEVAKLS